MSTDAPEFEEVLEHYGIKGMKWGVRRSDAQLARARGKYKKTPANMQSKDAKQVKTAKAKIKTPKKGEADISALTNDELKLVLDRMRLESQYSKLTTAPETKKGEHWVKKELSKTAETKMKDFITNGGVLKLIDWGIKVTTPLDFTDIKL
ncbi:MAG: hypothetical protein LC687_00960 [Actinobacteria bacterium]|nr:hypothetical protein [Actinomycetota bacterium]